jgi:hypothetical protein
MPGISNRDDDPGRMARFGRRRVRDEQNIVIDGGTLIAD